MKYLQIIIIFILTAWKAYPQYTVSGRVIDENSKTPLSQVTVYIYSLQKGTSTNEEGYFSLRKIPQGTYQFMFSYMGYETIYKTIEVKKDTTEIVVAMIEEATGLDDVIITTESKSKKLKKSVANVSVLQTKELHKLNTSGSDIVKQISGVNVRQSGGYGSQASIYINGMTGKQIKYFLDGIPLSFYGNSYGLNVIPISLIKQIEVYKGVTPIKFGADALGGSINLVSKDLKTSFLDISVSSGSFNTHKINVGGQLLNDDKKYTIGLNSSLNHSDNNYTVDVTKPNKSGNPTPIKVKRFHDRYTNYMANFYVKLFDESFADNLDFNIRSSGIYDDIQHDKLMNQPYGEATYKETSFGSSVNYSKKELFSNFDIKWFVGVNFINSHTKDISKKTYYWDGTTDKELRVSGGEMSSKGSLLNLYAKNVVNRFNFTYSPWENGKFISNILTSFYHRKGEDTKAKIFYGEDYFRNPVQLFKNVTGIAYQHNFNKKLETYTAIKHFHFNTDGYAIIGLDFVPNKQSVSNTGFLQSLKYNFTKQFLIKSSYEYATRLPDEYELFGEFILVYPNPFLEPEQSHNFNLGVQYLSPKINTEITTFLRKTENVIWLETATFFAQYQNLLKSQTKGIEADILYKPFSFLQLNFNMTYQDIRNKTPKEITKNIDSKYYNARLPNIPYLFGNSRIMYNKEQFLGSKNSFSFWWSANYVKEYFLYWAEDGGDKITIPSQFVQDIGTSYSLENNKLSISLQCNNLLNSKVYDNFNVQRPQRSFYITLRTFIN